MKSEETRGVAVFRAKKDGKGNGEQPERWEVDQEH